MSDACKCGHARSDHAYVIEDGPCGAQPDGCQKYAPADRDDLAAILAKHMWMWTVRDDESWDYGEIHCVSDECDWSIRQRVSSLSPDRPVPSDDKCYDAHRAHVAQMVLESNWLAAVKAEAFKRGWIDSAVHHATCHECGTGPLRHDIPDPYHADRVDAEDTDNTTDRT